MENLEGPKSGWSPVWGAKRLYTWIHLTMLFSFLTSPSVSEFFIKYKQQFPRASSSVQLSEVRNREGVSLGMGEGLWSPGIEDKLSALYWLSPVATSFQQDRLWWGDAKVLTLSHLPCSEPEHSCCRPDLQGSQLSVADERLVPICSATCTWLTNSGAVTVNKCNLLLWTRHPGKCLLLSLGIMFCTAVLWLCQIRYFSLTSFL